MARQERNRVEREIIKAEEEYREWEHKEAASLVQCPACVNVVHEDNYDWDADVCNTCLRSAD